MKFVVDTGRIVAALIKDSACRSILLSEKFEFLTVDFTKSEIDEHKPEILMKAKISEKQFGLIFSQLFSKIFIVNDITIQEKMDVAKEIMDPIDPGDTPFVALALAVESAGIWSDDRHFERQNQIKIWRTRVLLDALDKR